MNKCMKEFAETTINELLGWYGYNNTKNGHLKKNDSREVSPLSDIPPRTGECRSCGKPIIGKISLNIIPAPFCSEFCLSQYMQNGEQKKSCDWCQQLVTSVKFFDNENSDPSLRFCSEECLNQYKMHLFCQETQAHLEMYPHMPVDDNSNEPLITPDLWIKSTKHSAPPKEKVAQPQAIKKHNQEFTKKSNGNKKRLKPSSSFELYDLPQDLRVPKRNESETAINDTGGLVKKESILERSLKNEPVKPYYPLMSPPTLMVPYPVVLPLPIPIPIPIPLQAKDLKKLESKDFSCQTSEIETTEEIKCRPIRSLRNRKQLFSIKTKAKCKKPLLTEII